MRRAEPAVRAAVEPADDARSGHTRLLLARDDADADAAREAIRGDGNGGEESGGAAAAAAALFARDMSSFNLYTLTPQLIIAPLCGLLLQFLPRDAVALAYTLVWSASAALVLVGFAALAIGVKEDAPLAGEGGKGLVLIS